MPTLDELISPGYRATLAAHHRKANGYWGASGHSHALDVLLWASALDAKSVLDYGCGRGTLGPVLRQKGIEVREFDPGIETVSALPEPADLVVATDVLEHVEPDRLEVTLAFLRSITRAGAYFVIALSKAKDTLPDGRNAHLIQKPASWWQTQCLRAGFKVYKVEQRKGLILWLT